MKLWILTSILLLCVLAAFLSPGAGLMKSSLRAKQFAFSMILAVALAAKFLVDHQPPTQSILASPEVLERLPLSRDITELICVRLR